MCPRSASFDLEFGTKYQANPRTYPIYAQPWSLSSWPHGLKKSLFSIRCVAGVQRSSGPFGTVYGRASNTMKSPARYSPIGQKCANCIAKSMNWLKDMLVRAEEDREISSFYLRKLRIPGDGRRFGRLSDPAQWRTFLTPDIRPALRRSVY